MNDEYAAGLIDGEGWIGISKTAASTYAIRVQVGMVMKGTPILHSMKAEYGGRIGKRPAETERHAEKDVWVVDGQEAATFLEAIQPHLILKSEQAACALDLWDSILASRSQHGRKHWTDALRRHAHHLMLRVQELNARGPAAPAPELPRDRVPIARYRWGEWWEMEESLFGPTPFAESFPTSGSMIAGHLFAAPEPTFPEPSTLLPTPVAAEGTKPSNTMGVARRQATGQVFLTNVIVSLCGLDPSEQTG